jgi:flagellar biosynthesis/type III secretory pathway protein FliH
MASYRDTAVARQIRKALAKFKSSEAMRAYREGYAAGHKDGYMRALEEVI